MKVSLRLPFQPHRVRFQLLHCGGIAHLNKNQIEFDAMILCIQFDILFWLNKDNIGHQIRMDRKTKIKKRAASLYSDYYQCKVIHGTL